jgi:hypothetical protein
MSEFPATNSPASVPLPAPPASHYLNPLHSHACANRAENPNGITSLQKKVGGGVMFSDSQSGTMARGSGVFPPPLKPRPTTRYKQRSLSRSAVRRSRSLLRSLYDVPLGVCLLTGAAGLRGCVKVAVCKEATGRRRPARVKRIGRGAAIVDGALVQRNSS